MVLGFGFWVLGLGQGVRWVEVSGATESAMTLGQDRTDLAGF